MVILAGRGAAAHIPALAALAFVALVVVVVSHKRIIFHISHRLSCGRAALIANKKQKAAQYYCPVSPLA